MLAPSSAASKTQERMALTEAKSSDHEMEKRIWLLLSGKLSGI